VVDGGEGGEGSDDFDQLTFASKSTVRVIRDQGNPKNGNLNFLDQNGNVVVFMAFTNIEKVVPCFTDGTLIVTERGPVPVKALSAGDMVSTRDNGLQSVRWVGRRHLPERDLVRSPDMRPVRIASGALGPAMPDRDIAVSPRHRVLFGGARAELLFGEAEVPVAAKHLTRMAGVSREVPPDSMTYVHVLFDRHEVILSNEPWTESFQPAARTVNALEEAQRDEVLSLFPEISEGLQSNHPAARPTLKAHKARALLT
jgi:hypothetical protein